MATYKVIQDIEAEDKLLGPLTLRQFIYAMLTVGLVYFCVIVTLKGASFLLPVFGLPAIFTGFFAFPWSKEQPTEVWALAKIQFMLKPHRRVWDQSGVKELVTVTAPKKIEKHYTNGLTQTEVHSRLQALADTIDSRGWAIKNVNVNLYAQPSLLTTGLDSDRLIDINSLPQEVPAVDVSATDDIMDAQSSPIAQQFDQMIAASSQAHRQQLMQQLAQPTTSATTGPGQETPADYWFLTQPTSAPQVPKDAAMFTKPPVILPGGDDNQIPIVHAADPTPSEEALAEQLKAQHDKPEVSYSHLRTIRPLDTAPVTAPVATPPQLTAPPDPAILELANNNDLNVATLARQANRSRNPKGPPQDEVVISLH